MDIIVKYAKRTIALAQGKVLLDGPTHEVFAQSKLLAATFVKLPEITQLATIKTTKRWGVEKVCPQKECGWKEQIEPPAPKE